VAGLAVISTRGEECGKHEGREGERRLRVDRPQRRGATTCWIPTHFSCRTGLLLFVEAAFIGAPRCPLPSLQRRASGVGSRRGRRKKSKNNANYKVWSCLDAARARVESPRPNFKCKNGGCAILKFTH
jgi:hypothetical protein